MTVTRIVWIISDGIPGHYNQSLGIVMALQKAQPCKVHWVELTLRVGFFRRVLRILLNHTCRAWSLTWMRFFYHFDELPTESPDLLVGAGGKASFALAWLSRLTRAPAIFTGSLRGLSYRNFSHTFSIDPRQASPNTIVLDVTPMPVDVHEQQKAASDMRLKMGMGSQRLWLLLLGGDGAGAHFKEADWRRLAEEANRLAEREGIKWLVSTSRRTGAAAELILQKTLRSELLADAVWWSREPRRVLQAYFGASEVVCCTAESMSMLAESICSEKPIIAWQPEVASFERSYAEALDRMVLRKLIVLTSSLDSVPAAADFSAHRADIADIASMVTWRARNPDGSALFVVGSPLQMLNAMEARERFHAGSRASLIVIAAKPIDRAQIFALVDGDWHDVACFDMGRLFRLFYPVMMSRCIKRIGAVDWLYLGYPFKLRAHLANTVSYTNVAIIDDGHASLEIAKQLSSSSQLRSRRTVHDFLLGRDITLSYAAHAFFFTAYPAIAWDEARIIANDYRCTKQRVLQMPATVDLVFIGSQLAGNVVASLDDEIALICAMADHYADREVIYALHRYDDADSLRQGVQKPNLRFVRFNTAVEVAISLQGMVPRQVSTFGSSAALTISKIYDMNVEVLAIPEGMIKPSIKQAWGLIYQEYAANGISIHSMDIQSI